MCSSSCGSSFSLDFILPSGIGEVVAMMAGWNKISLDSPYPANIQSSVGEGLVRVSDARSVEFFWILSVGVSFKRSY